jgi:hypothetical protein
MCRTIGQHVFVWHQSSFVMRGYSMLISISGPEFVYFVRCLVGMPCGAKTRRRNLRVLVWRHTLHDVTGVQWNTTNTIAQLKVPTFPICGRENVCSIPNALRRVHRKWSLTDPSIAYLGIYFDQIVWTMNYCTYEHFFALHSKNNHCTKQQRS